MDLAGVKALCFDFDGTLADNYTAIAACVNAVRASKLLPPLTVTQVKRHVGRGHEVLLRETCPGIDIATGVAIYRETFPKVIMLDTWLLPGAAHMLARLHQSGKRLAVCSNKLREFTAELLRRLDVAAYFDAVLGPEDVAKPKPAPDMLLAAMTKLQVSADECIYVGDMTVDIETARAAGVTVWVVPTGSDDLATLKAARPDRILKDLEEINHRLAGAD